MGICSWGELDEFAMVAKGLVSAGVQAVEVNLSCPNLEDGRMFSLDASRSAEVITAVASSCEVPVGAKLRPTPTTSWVCPPRVWRQAPIS